MSQPRGTQLEASTAARLLDAGAAMDLAQTLTTWRTVDRRHVHKLSLAEVLVTDLTPLGPDSYAAAVQWPRWHPFFRPHLAPAPHPLLFVESLRQAGIYLTHQTLGVPLGQQFIFQSIAADYSPGAWRQLPLDATTVVLALRVGPYDRGRPGSIRLEIEAWWSARLLATATATYRCLSLAAYTRVRDHGLAWAAAARAVIDEDFAADHQGEIDEGRSLLQADYLNATFFDHPVDHLPGMVLMDAALTAAGIADPDDWCRLRKLEMTFSRYAELRLPTHVTTHSSWSGDHGVTSVRISQAQQTAATGTVAVSGARPEAA